MEREMTLGSRIAEARRSAGLTQEQLGERVGAVQTAVAKWEGGDNEPSLAALTRIAAATGRPVEWIAFGVAPPSAVFDGPALLSALVERLMHQHAEVMTAISELAERLGKLEER
jgi:transcriptional regulator with XRE-family HTH domain